MSVRASTWAWQQQGISQGEKMVLLALADFSHPDGTCWPKQSTVAEMALCGERSVRRHLLSLESQGLISRARRSTVDGRQSDAYLLEIPEDAHGATGQFGRLRNRPTETPQPDSSGRLAQSVVTTNEPSAIEPQAKTPPTVYSAQFLSFWAAYPNKVDKGAAFPAWKARIKAGADPDRIIAGAVTYAKDCQVLGTEKRFIKHPKTWLNAEAWDNAPMAAGGAAPVRASEQERLDPPDDLISKWSDECSDREYSERIQEWRRAEMARRGWVA